MAAAARSVGRPGAADAVAGLVLRIAEIDVSAFPDPPDLPMNRTI